MKYIKTWVVTADHKARPKNPCVDIKDCSYRKFEKEAAKHTYSTSETLPPGEYPAEMFAEPVWQYRSLDKDMDWWGDWKNTFEIHAKSLFNTENCTRKYLPLKSIMKKEVKEQEYRNSFEDYPELAERLLHAASFWKVDDTWSATLAEINKVCEQLTIAKNANWESK